MIRGRGMLRHLLRMRRFVGLMGIFGRRWIRGGIEVGLMGVNLLSRKGIRSKYKSGGFIVHMYETKIIFIGKESIAKFTPTAAQMAFLNTYATTCVETPLCPC